jgi:hypothetical protein
MAWLRLSIVAGLIGAVATAGHCRATRSWQVTTDGRSMRGAFSPEGDRIAYVQYGPKSFDKAGNYGFETRVRVWSKSGDRVLLRVPPVSKRGGPDHALGLWTQHLAVRWLPSGRHLVVGRPSYPGDGWIVAADGSRKTRAAVYTRRKGGSPSWYVTNDVYPLGHDDEIAVARLLPYLGGDFALAPWVYDGVAPPLVQHQGTSWPVMPGGSLQHPLIVPAVLYARPGGSASSRTITPSDGLTFTCGDPQGRCTGPDGRHILYRHAQDGSSDLWVVHKGGSGDHRLVRDVWTDEWLTRSWVVYTTRGGRSSESPKQVGIINIHTRSGQLLTAGPFEHKVCDYRNGRFLIEEHPTGQSGELQANLYVIEPLRARM